MPSTITDTRKLCIHTVTTKPWPLNDAIRHFSQAGVKGMTVWRDALDGHDIKAAGEHIRSAGMDVVSLCRGGFFPATSAAKRQEAIDDNRRAIDEAAELGAPLIVLVCGADPDQPMSESRQHIQDGIEAVLDHAEARNVKLGIEPLHPLYADTRSAVNTMAQANDMCAAINSPYLGVTVDVYHLWWDPHLEAEIKRCGDMGKLFSFHVCDWKVPTTDLLLDRGLMGEGCINIPQIRGWVEDTGFDGFIEVEIFSTAYWSTNQAVFLDKVLNAYLDYV